MMMRGYPDSGFLNISSLSWRAHYTVPYCYVSTVSGNSPMYGGWEAVSRLYLYRSQQNISPL